MSSISFTFSIRTFEFIRSTYTMETKGSLQGECKNTREYFTVWRSKLLIRYVLLAFFDNIKKKMFVAFIWSCAYYSFSTEACTPCDTLCAILLNNSIFLCQSFFCSPCVQAITLKPLPFCLYIYYDYYY